VIPPTPTNLSDWFSGWRLQLLVASITLAAIGYLGFSLWGGWEDVSAAVVRMGPAIILLALLMSLLNYGLRFVRWNLYLQQLGYRIPLRPNLGIYLSGFALTTTPAKAGEALRAVLLKAWHVPYKDSLSALLSERISDLLAVLAMAAIGISQYPQYSPLLWFFAVLIPLFWVVIANQTLQTQGRNVCQHLPARLSTLANHLFDLLESTRRCHPPKLIFQASMLSLVAWCAEGLAFFWILQQLQTGISLEIALFIYAIAMLAGAASFMPGGLGGAELAMTGLLSLNNVPLADAIAASLVIRLATLWFAVLLGGLALALGKQNIAATGGNKHS
jgi:uncharacterized protein (TIRG00374 family)